MHGVTRKKPAALALLTALLGSVPGGSEARHPGAAPPVLSSPFSSIAIHVDGVMEAPWLSAPPVRVETGAPPAGGAPAAGPSARGEVRSLWDGAHLYLWIRVTDHAVTASAPNPVDRDGVEIYLDFYNDKIPKNEEDDALIRISSSGELSGAGPYAERLEAFAAAPIPGGGDETGGYAVELALALGGLPKENGTALGIDFAINDAAPPENRRRFRIFWSDGNNRELDDNSRWGELRLSGRDAKSALALDTYPLRANIEKAEALPRGIWREEAGLDEALAAARDSLLAADQEVIDGRAARLGDALGALRRAGKFPDPFDLPETVHLPDPFRFRDGGRVRSAGDWDRRRKEILELAQYYEFGPLPPPPRSVKGTAEGAAVAVTVEDRGRSASFSGRLSLPTEKGSGRKAPYPVVVSIDFRAMPGNKVLLDSGYAVLSVPYSAVASDDDARNGAFYTLYPYDVAAGADTGVLMAWAWGASRALDALGDLAARDPALGRQLDLEKAVVTGFSRCGKAALLAGLTDDRFGVVNPGASGCGGAAPYRYDSFGNTPYRTAPFGNVYPWGVSTGCEVLGDHVRHQGHNSNEMLARFLNPGRIYKTRTPGYGERLPFDHHELIAAIAPRAVILTAAFDDYANGAEGDSIGMEGARPVFEFLGAAPRLAFNLRTADSGPSTMGGHYVDEAQTRRLAAFLDMVLRGIPLPRDARAALYSNPYLPAYDRYYGGLRTMMPWLDAAPPPAGGSPE